MRPFLKRALLDVDGVCAKFHERALSVMNRELMYSFEPRHMTEWDVTAVLPTEADRETMNNIIGRSGFCTSLEPYPEAQAAVSALRDAGVEVCFATSPHPGSRSWMKEREAWLMEHFEARHEDIIHVHKKYWLLADVLVDDKPSHIREWVKHHPEARGFLWDQPYNQLAKDIPRADSWKSVLDVFIPP